MPLPGVMIVDVPKRISQPPPARPEAASIKTLAALDTGKSAEL